MNPLLRASLRRYASFASVWIGLLGGCSSNFPEKLREHTYPPDFNYITADALESTMWQFAAQIDALDERLRNATAGDEALQGDVARMLGEIERSAKALGPGDWPSNHPRVSRNIEAFRLDVARARRAVEISPPNYYLAGSISGACTHCHGPE